MKKVSVAAELAVIEQAVEAAGLLIEVGRQGGVEDEDAAGLAAAVLVLARCRLRDLGRTVRGTLPVEHLAASHNGVVEGSTEKDVVLEEKRRARR